MKQLALVGLGGFIGAIGRYLLGGAVLHLTASWRFPVSTFLVNLAGCFCLGALAALAEQRDFFSPALRLFLFTGILGGFTTFSAFGYECFFLLRRGEVLVAALYAMGSVGGGLGAVWIGFRLLSVLAPR